MVGMTRCPAALLPALLAMLGALAAGCADPPPRDPAVAQRAQLAKDLAGMPQGPERVAKEIQLATVALPYSRDAADWHARLATAVAALRALLDERTAAGDVAAAAHIRVAYGRHLSMQGEFAAAAEQFDHVLALDPPSPHVPAALTEKASNLFRQKDFAGCKALLERVIAEHPGTPEAIRGPTGIHSCERELQRPTAPAPPPAPARTE